MPILVGLVLGAVLGFAIGGNALIAFAGAFVGLIAGLAVAARRGAPSRDVTATSTARIAPDPSTTHWIARIVELERRVATLEAEASGAAAPRDARSPSPLGGELAIADDDGDLAVAPSPGVGSTGAWSPTPESMERRGADVPSSITDIHPLNAAEAEPLNAPSGARATTASPPPPESPNRIVAWIVGGNAPARVGAVILIIGVGLLLRYAAAHLTVPISYRLAGVAAFGAALLAAGWNLRHRRPDYAMIVQGAGIGVLYLTAFAAFRLYDVLPPAVAFGLLLAVTVLSIVLAVREDSMTLATLGSIGGFLAPILTSTRSGNHVLLFSYYAIINGGIFAIAWFKAWRMLNLLGFVATFIVGVVWGVTRYRRADFATTEPFLILFFLFYVGIAILYAQRRSLNVRHTVDGTLVFGTPLVAAALQHALVRDFEYGMAWSALAASGVYLGLAAILHARRREASRELTLAFVALGIAFATLAVPLAFDARWTSAMWAQEGVALVFFGLRQQRVGATAFGIAIQLAGGIAFGIDRFGAFSDLPVDHLILNADFLGAAVLALAGLASAWMLEVRAHELRSGWRIAMAALLAWGTLWWLYAGAREIDAFVPWDARHPAWVGFLCATAIGFAATADRLRWPAARVPAWLLLPSLLAIAAVAIFGETVPGHHLLAGAGVIAWPIAAAVVQGLLRHFERDSRGAARADLLPLAHAGVVWLIALVSTHELAWLAGREPVAADTWRIAALGLVPALMLVALGAWSARGGWPVAAWPRAYLVTGALPLVVWLTIWTLTMALECDGDATPLRFIPIANPLDVTQGIVALAIIGWGARLSRGGVDWRSPLSPALLKGSGAAMLFIAVNAAALRAIHDGFDVPYTLFDLRESTIVQATLSILWTAFALVTMVLANRRGERAGWIAGAILLGIVVVKLVLVDLSHAGTIARIVSFIGVGLLLLLTGYLAPVPPRDPES